MAPVVPINRLEPTAPSRTCSAVAPGTAAWRACGPGSKPSSGCRQPSPPGWTTSPIASPGADALGLALVLAYLLILIVVVTLMRRRWLESCDDCRGMDQAGRGDRKRRTHPAPGGRGYHRLWQRLRLQLDDLPRIAAVLAATNTADGGLVLHGHEPKDGLRVDGAAASAAGAGTIIGLGSWRLHVENVDAVGQTGAQANAASIAPPKQQVLGISLAFFIGLISGAAAIACIWWLKPREQCRCRRAGSGAYRIPRCTGADPHSGHQHPGQLLYHLAPTDLSDEARALVARHAVGYGQQPTMHLGLDDQRLSFTELRDWTASSRFRRDSRCISRRMPEGSTLIPSAWASPVSSASWPLVFSCRPWPRQWHRSSPSRPRRIRRR